MAKNQNPRDEFLSLFVDALNDANKNRNEKRLIIFNGQRPNEPNYGISPENPLCSTTLSGTEDYLSRLRTADDKPFTWQRTGATWSNCNGAIDVCTDKYQLFLDGIPYAVLYFVPYVGESTAAPYGMKLCNNNSGKETYTENTKRFQHETCKDIEHSIKKEIGQIEKEIHETKKQLHELRKKIDQMGLCWFGKRRRDKAALEKEFAIIQIKLLSLHDNRSRLKVTAAKSDIDNLAEQIVLSVEKHSKIQKCKYLCYSKITKLDTVIFAFFLVRAMCLIAATNKESVLDFDGKFINKFLSLAGATYLPNDPQLFQTMFDNRTSFYDKIFMSREGIDDKTLAILEEFEIIIKTDIVNDDYVDFSDRNPMPILSNGFLDDVMCNAEVMSFFQNLPDLLSPFFHNVQNSL